MRYFTPYRIYYTKMLNASFWLNSERAVSTVPLWHIAAKFNLRISCERVVKYANCIALLIKSSLRLASHVCAAIHYTNSWRIIYDCFAARSTADINTRVNYHPNNPTAACWASGLRREPSLSLMMLRRMYFVDGVQHTHAQ
jgi:hypothetical protein